MNLPSVLIAVGAASIGLEGGEPGEIGHNAIERQDGMVERLDSKAEVTVQPGDVFVIETPGGGGYGLPPNNVAQ